MSPPGRVAPAVQRLLHRREEGLQLLQRVFGELAIGGDLAAEDREQRRIAIDIEDIVAGHGRWVGGVVVIERAHAGEVVHDVLARAAASWYSD